MFQEDRYLLFRFVSEQTRPFDGLVVVYDIRPFRSYEAVTQAHFP
jgi:hypothetical protein